MVRSEFVGICLRGFVAVACVTCTGVAAKAVVIDFESPAYVAGNPIGQDGWVAPGYVGTPNGVVEVSSANPLSGGQSLSYTRTAPLGGPFGADVAKPDVIVVAADGTPAADLSASVLLSTTPGVPPGTYGYGAVGFFLSPNSVGGETPIGVQLNNAGSTIPSIEVFADYGPGIGPAYGYIVPGNQAASAFPAGDTIEFNIDVDFDSSTFLVAYRNATLGGSFSSPAGPYAFAGGFPVGPGGAIEVDVIATFRFGNGQIDDITLTGNEIPEPATIGLCVVGVVALALRRKLA